MPKRISRKRPRDVNQLANYLVKASTGEDNGSIAPPTKQEISALMSQMGRKGGKIGGKRRLETMTPEQRSKAAKKAAEARWSKKVES